MSGIISAGHASCKDGAADAADGNACINTADYRDEIELRQAEQAAFLAILEAGDNIVAGPWFKNSAWSTPSWGRTGSAGSLYRRVLEHEIYRGRHGVLPDCGLVGMAVNGFDADQEFREAAAKRGLIIKRLIADGAVHRCDVEGKRGKNDGSYLLNLNNGGIPWGWFENHKDGEGWEIWKPNGGGKQWTEAEKAAYKRQLAAEQARRAKEELERRDIARKRAAEIVSAATKPPADHPYFIKKQIKPPHGVLSSADPIAIWHWADSRTTAPGVLVVPMRDIDGVLHNVQLIDGEGNKDYLGGGLKTGCFFVVSANGKLDPAGLNLPCEGLATSATCHEAADAPAICAFDAGNLDPVIAAVRKKYPTTHLLLCGDDDWKTVNKKGEPSNTGRIKGTAAAEAAGIVAVFPEFNPDQERHPKWTDFNDLACAEGLDVVRRQLDDARKEPPPEGAERLVRLYATIKRLAALHPDLYAVVDMKAEADAIGGISVVELRRRVNAARKAAAGNKPNDSKDILDVINEINADHAFIVSRGGKACVLFESFDEKGELKELHHSIYDFHEIMLNRGTVMVGDKEIAKSRLWMKHPLRREYQGIVFDPTTTERDVRGHYNLWRGFGVEPKRGSWALMQDHIRNILAAGDEETEDYIRNWLGWGVQNPEMQAEAVLAFRGPPGSGKGVLGRAYVSMYGRHGLQISSNGLLTGRFRGHLERIIALFADEAFHVGDKAAESQLKNITTEPIIMIEDKGKTAFAADNRLKIMMASNENWIAPVGQHERRFSINDVSHARIKDKPYFTKLINEIKAGGVSAMLYDLLEMDITGFHPRWNIPQTEALKEQARYSLSPEMKWLLLLLKDGRLPASDHPKHPNRTALAHLMESARKAIDRKKPLQDADMIELLVKWGVKAKHTKSGNVWEFPPLAEMRARFDREYGKQDWPITDEEQKLREQLAFTDIPPRKWS